MTDIWKGRLKGMTDIWKGETKRGDGHLEGDLGDLARKEKEQIIMEMGD